MIGITVSQFLIEEQRKFPSATGDLTLVLQDIVTACKAIALAMRYGRLSGTDLFGVSTGLNVHGETQKTLDVLANELFVQHTALAGHIAAMVSEEMDAPQLPTAGGGGRYLLVYDPVDGSANLGEDAVVGTIFSILRRPEEAEGPPALDEFLQPGTKQVCAGYAIYGPSCMLVMTTGNGVNGFTLDPGLGEFLLSDPGMTIPLEGTRLCVNVTHKDRWDESTASYIEDIAGRPELRSRDFDLRWSGCAVADVHRLLVSGGIYLSPLQPRRDDGSLAGKLRLLYEINPLAMIVEQAGGLATAGSGRVLEVDVSGIHQLLPVILGAKTEVNHLLTEYLGLQPMTGSDDSS